MGVINWIRYFCLATTLTVALNGTVFAAISPTPGSVLSSSISPVEILFDNGAQEYWVRGSDDLGTSYDSGRLTEGKYNLPLPDSGNIYLELFSKTNGSWSSVNVSYSVSESPPNPSDQSYAQRPVIETNLLKIYERQCYLGQDDFYEVEFLFSTPEVGCSITCPAGHVATGWSGWGERDAYSATDEGFARTYGVSVRGIGEPTVVVFLTQSPSREYFFPYDPDFTFGPGHYLMYAKGVCSNTNN